MRYLSNKEKKQLNQQLPKGYTIDKKDEIKEFNSTIYKGDSKLLIIKNKRYLPHLKSIDTSLYKCVYVDRGAIPFIAKGADLMRPGIRKIDNSFEKDDIVVVKEEEMNKTIALGIALLSSEEMEKQEKGKSLEIFHYVGDEYY